MSFQSLIVHNGVVHQKSNSVEQLKSSTTENKTVIEPTTDSKAVAPKSNSSSKKLIVETNQTEIENSSNTEIQTISNSTSTTLLPGFGESIFTLLIVSPFLLFGIKKWLHR